MVKIEKSVRKCRREHKLPMSGVAPSNIRRQVKRLKDAFVVEKVGQTYRLAEDAALHEVFTEKIEKFYLPTIVSRVKEYCEAVERERWKHGKEVS
jgi:predicted transcriptional regulator